MALTTDPIEATGAPDPQCIACGIDDACLYHADVSPVTESCDPVADHELAAMTAARRDLARTLDLGPVASPVPLRQAARPEPRSRSIEKGHGPQRGRACPRRRGPRTRRDRVAVAGARRRAGEAPVDRRVHRLAPRPRPARAARMTTAADIAPLSATRPDRTGGLAAFTDACSWVDRAASFGGDRWLLVLLDERCRWLEAERLGHSHHVVLRDHAGAPELPSVGELPAEWVTPLLEDVRARYPGWRLAGGDDEPVHDRLDAHFAARQDARRLEVAARQSDEAEQARRREDVDRETDRRAVEQARDLYGLDSNSA
jgi:hypothetical protein